MVEDRIKPLVEAFSSLQGEILRLVTESTAKVNPDDRKAVSILVNRLKKVERAANVLESLSIEWLQEATQLLIAIQTGANRPQS